MSTLLFFRAIPNHLLEKVVDGYNREIEFIYSNATANSIFGKGSAKTYPLNSIQLPMFLVSTMSEPDGVGSITYMDYRYNDATLHRRGIGFMGFGHTEANNSTTEVKTESFFTIKDNLIPSNGKTNFSTLLEKTKVTKSNQVVSETEYTNEIRDQGNGRIWALTPKTTSYDFITGAVSTSSSGYDAYGNVLSETNAIMGVQTTVTSTLYEQHGSWIPSSPTSSTITSTRQGAPSFSKTTTRIFDTKGNPTTEIEFDGNAKAVKTETIYYPVGLPRVVTISAAGVKTKTNTFEYDPNFRHLTKTTNSLNQVASSSFDVRWSKPTSITDVGGLTVSYGYDPLGREKTMTPPLGYTVNTFYNWGGKGLYNILVEHPTMPDSREHFDIFERSFAKEMEHFKGNWLNSSQIFDNKGRISSKTSPAGVITKYSYYPNAAERLLSTNNGIGQTIYKYKDNNGETETEVTSTAGHIYISTTDAVGKLVKKIDDGGILDYEYDSQGNPTKVKLGGKQISLVQYDGVGHRASFAEINAGTTAYQFDAFGQLIYQKTSNTFETTYEYTVLGQVDNRKGKEGTTTYEYMKSGAAINSIEKVNGFNGYDQISTYDGLGRVENYTEVTDGISFTHKYEYDPISGNPTKETYPTGFFVTREFDQNSYLEKVRSDKGIVIFDGLAVDAYGNYTDYKLGNGLNTSNTFDTYGFPVSSSTPGALELDFGFEQKSGNLLSRSDKGKGLSDIFTYDNLDRLETVTGSGKPLKISYTADGNINNKTDIGTYEYKKIKINAVQKVTRPKGFEDIAVTQPITYTPFDQPDEVSEGEYWLDVNSGGASRHYNFTYGPDYQRRMMEYRRGVVLTVGGHPDPNTGFVHDQIVEERRYYVGNYEEFRVAPSEKNPEEQIFNIHYIEGGDGVCAILLRKGEIDSMFYVHKDYLGSFLTFTGEKGGIVYEQNFDAWGNYRNIKDWSYVKKNHIPQWLRRGYTGHEHLIRFEPHAWSNYDTQTEHSMFMPFNIINMNGRIYDPMIGRMMSPDNYAHDGAGSQGYNRYSYANNNPLKFTDPDGNVWHIILGAAIGGIANVYTHWGKITEGGSIDWGKLGAAATIGAGAGALAAIIGPAIAPTLTAFGGAGAAAAVGNGIINGAIAGGIGAGISSSLQGFGNSIVFGDIYSGKRLRQDILLGIAGGAVIGGVGGYRQWKGSTGNHHNTDIPEQGNPRGTTKIETGSSGDFVGPPDYRNVNAYGEGGDLGYLGMGEAGERTASSITAESFRDYTLQFGSDANQTHHTFRHVIELGLDPTQVQTAVGNHFSSVSSQIVTGKPFNQIIMVAGQKLQYTAYKLPNGVINIGRIHGF